MLERGSHIEEKYSAHITEVCISNRGVHIKERCLC